MTRTYDTGLTLPLPTVIAQGIRSKITPLLRSAGGFVAAIVDFPHVMGGGSDDEINLLLDICGGRAPVLAIGLGDIKTTRKGSAGNNFGTMDVEIYAVSAHMRNVTDGRLHPDPTSLIDDTADPGIFATNELVAMYLADQFPVATETQWGKLFGSTVKELRLDGIRHLITGQEMSIWGVQFSLGFELQQNMLRGATAYLTDIMTYHRFGAGSTPDPTTPPLITTDTPNLPRST
jgi:hypothetical protein